MPKYRSITISVVSWWEMKRFPEFPHPDSAECRHPGLAQGSDCHQTERPPSTFTSSTSKSQTDGRPERDPTISCYIPSIPGIRFFLKYTIEPPHPEGQLFYFKLFMNGRHVTSWGVNPKKNPKGQILRGLFEPEGSWSISQSNGTTLKQSGIESRPFLFTPEVEGRSAADDGGLIEVRIFRAIARKRRAQSLEVFRPQEQYGINLPSAGLLDKPQDTRYYDYILVDPKDEPYAAFLFHYRSWEFLQSLELIPASHPRALLQPSNSFAFLAEPSTNEEFQEGDEEVQLGCDEEDSSWVPPEESPRRQAHISQLRRSMLDDRPRHVGTHNENCKADSLSLQKRKTRAGIPTSSFSVPRATLDNWAYNRPLPRLPKPKSSFDHTRNSSTSSNAPSITPSLIPWLDRNSDDSSPEPVIGIAVKVPVLSSSPGSSDSDTDLSCSSADRYTDNPPQREQPIRFISNPSDVPLEATFLPTSTTVRKPEIKKLLCILPQHRHLIDESKLGSSIGAVSSAPKDFERHCKLQNASAAKRSFKPLEVGPRQVLARATTADENVPFVLVKSENTAWAMNDVQDQQAGDSDSLNQQVAHPPSLGAVTSRQDDQPNKEKYKWI